MVVISVVVWAICLIFVILYIGQRPSVVSQPSVEQEVIIKEVLVPVPPENTAYYKDITLTDEEWLHLGRMIFAEAGNQTDVGKRAVVEVIFNRMLSDDWPDTLTDVLNQDNPRQFTSVSGVDDKTAKEQYHIIEAVLREEDPILRGDVVYFATYKANGTFYEQIGDHYFCY